MLDPDWLNPNPQPCSAPTGKQLCEIQVELGLISGSRNTAPTYIVGSRNSVPIYI
jgi:hypothetical protein